MSMRPVLYLDLDDTVISWADGGPRPAPGVGEFLLWALDTFEVRWLTRWARDGDMDPGLLRDLAKLTSVPEDRLREIRGLDWGWDGGDWKLNGIAWLDHVGLGRPFVWLEDEGVGQREIDLLARHGFPGCYWHCNVTRDPDVLRSIQGKLQRAYGQSSAA